jgi:hypothetical protein
MKRFALVLLAVMFALPCAVGAQGLTMQMSNGWSFTFAGNVNAFLVYEKEDSGGAVSSPGALVGNSGDGATRIRTGLLPAFATFDAKGKEGNLNLGVHFGFAPQIQCGAIDGTPGADHDCFGAQIDMRQVFLTVGGSWGQILAGRELALFGRQNILNDQTLYGIGATGGQFSGGTTLGRIGFGYDYPNFVAQMTYSSRSDRPLVVSFGLFDPSVNGPYTQIQLPRVEAEAVWSRQQHKFWVGGLVQSNKSPADSTATSYGLSGGVKLGFSGFGIVGSGFWGKGIGTTLLFTTGNGTAGGGGSDDLRTTIGYIGQVTYTPRNSKITVAGSYGVNQLKYATSEDTPAARFKTENGLISGGLYYQWTKSLKFVAEFNYAWSKEKEANPQQNKSFAPAVGLMLFF